MDLKELFKDAPDGAKKLGVVGYPLEHSLSPAIQTAAIRAGGVDAVYKKIEVPPEEWADFLAQARDLPLDGFNVTVPFKERLLKDWPAGDEVMVGEEAGFCGAVNTVDREDADGRSSWGLYNTDGLGFAEDLESEGVDISGKNVVLLGAGGAARAVLSVFPTLDPAKVTVVNRTEEKAQALVKEMRQKLDLPSQRLAAVSGEGVQKAVAEAALLINATSAGLKDGAPATVDTAWLHGNMIVYDLVYHRETELMKAARAAGADVFGGLGMLVCQGAKSFQIWFGKKAPVDAMRAAAEKALKKA
jgi:shikimate dehydrogenase